MTFVKEGRRRRKKKITITVVEKRNKLYNLSIPLQFEDKERRNPRRFQQKEKIQTEKKKGLENQKWSFCGSF